MFSIIAAVGKNRELGKKGDLIFHIKEDIKFFKETTSGHTVVMGTKTWQSLPKKLPNRKNIVVTSAPIEGPDECVTNLEEYIANNENTPEEIFVIGGGSIYTQFINHAKRIYLTEIDGEDSEADVFFPDFDKTKYQRTVLQTGTSGDLSYTMYKYEA